MLWGLLAVAIPILIWLFNRFRFRTVQWAAQTFLLRALRRSQRRLKIENLLLLLIRCAAIAFFVAALARPHGQAAVVADTTDARRNVVLLLDTSYSTGYQLGTDANQTVHEREKRAAKDLVRQLRPVDRLSVVAFDDHAREIYAAPRSVDARTQREILDELETLPEVQRGARGTDYGEPLQLLPEVLKRFDAGPDGQPPPPDTPPSPKTVFLLTDMQRSGLLQGTNLRRPQLRGISEDIRKLGASFFIVDCGAEEPKNAGIVTLETREPIVGVNLPCYIECIVKNWGTVAPGKNPGAKGEAMSGLTVEYFVDGGDTPVKAVSLDLAPEETKQLEPLRYVFHERGPHRVTARLKSDALQIDNERTLVVDVREAVRVLLVDGEPRTEKWESETDFLKVALDPFGDAAQGKDLIRPEVVLESALPVATLRDYDLVVLANVVSLPDEHISALEQYAREGGAIVFTMGNMVDKDHYDEKLWRRGAGLFPCKLGELKGAELSERGGDRDPNAPEWVLALADPEHPVLRIFGDEEMRPWLKRPSFYRFYEVSDLTVAAERGPKGLASVPVRFVPRPKEAGENTPDDPTAVREGSPALVEKAFGRGRVAAYLSSIDGRRVWNNAVMFDGFYLIFWRQYALELARTSRPRRNLAIGERYERVIGTSEYAPTVEVIDPLGVKETFRPEPIEGREQFRIGYPPSAEARVVSSGAEPASDNNARREETAGCERPGIYEVRLTGGAGDTIPPPPDYFAVRLDPAEGEVARLDLEDWREQLPALDVHRAPPDSLGDAFQGPGQGPQGNDLWPYAVAGVVVLLALESLLAALFGRRRQ
jgi:hypothetical protein